MGMGSSVEARSASFVRRAALAKLNAREKILKSSFELFNEFGIHRTGMDRIISESGVAKMTLYNHFPTKNDLVLEFFRFQHELWDTHIQKYTLQKKGTALEQFLGLFDGAKVWNEDVGFCGCVFMRGLSDFNQDRDAIKIQNEIQKHFDGIDALVKKLLKPLRPKDYKKLAPQIISLAAGSTLVAQATQSSQIFKSTKELAKQIVQS